MKLSFGISKGHGYVILALPSIFFFYYQCSHVQ